MFVDLGGEVRRALSWKKGNAQTPSDAYKAGAYSVRQYCCRFSKERRLAHKSPGLSAQKASKYRETDELERRRRVVGGKASLTTVSLDPSGEGRRCSHNHQARNGKGIAADIVAAVFGNDAP